MGNNNSVQTMREGYFEEVRLRKLGKGKLSEDQFIALEDAVSKTKDGLTMTTKSYNYKKINSSNISLRGGRSRKNRKNKNRRTKNKRRSS